MYQEPVRTLPRGKRRAYDLLCTAVDTDRDADPSAGSAVLGPGRPIAGPDPGSGARPHRAVEPGTGDGSATRTVVEGFSARAAAEGVRSSAASPSADASLRAVIEMALRHCPWDAASISVLGPGGTMLPAACSGEWAAEVDRLQDDLGEGPSLDVIRPERNGYRTEPVVVAVDLSAEGRWPRWGPAAKVQGYPGRCRAAPVHRPHGGLDEHVCTAARGGQWCVAGRADRCRLGLGGAGPGLL